MAERPPRWRESLGIRLGAAFTATALAAVTLVTVVALVATGSGVTELAAEHRAQTVDDVVAALEGAYLAGGGWQDADLLPAHTLAAAAGAVLIVTTPDLGELPPPPDLEITRRQFRDHGRAEHPEGTPGAELPTELDRDDHLDDHEVDQGTTSGRDEGVGGRRQGAGTETSEGSGSPVGGEGAVNTDSAPRLDSGPTAPTGPRGQNQPSSLVVEVAVVNAPNPSADRLLTAASEPETVADRVEAPIVADGQEVGTATLLFVTRDVPDATSAFQAQLGRSLLVGAVLAAVLALLVTAFVTARLTRPLRRLTADVDRIRRGAPADEAPHHEPAPGEIGVLTAALDGMAADLRHQERLRRALVADVGHELRTPVTILLGELEALRDGILEADAAELASLHEEVQRIARLVEDVDSLAEAEAAGFSLERTSVELAVLVEEALRGFVTPLAAADLALVTDLEAVETIGDRRRLEQVVRNLLSNAAKYAPAGTSIEVAVRRAGETAVVRVADRGPGFHPEELPSVFERFWRGSAAHGTGGSGIGLAVVAEVVRAHGGTVSAANRPGGGAVLEVRLPVAPTPEGRGPDPRTRPGTAAGSGPRR
jgi:two-component system, OmpR family, sensor histidine kinase BaeS